MLRRSGDTVTASTSLTNSNSHPKRISATSSSPTSPKRIQSALILLRSLQPALRAILSVCEEGSRDVDDGTRVATETNAEAGVVFRPLEVGVQSHDRQDGYHGASYGPSPQNEIQDPQHFSSVHLFVTTAGSPSGPRTCACYLIPSRTICALRNFLANQTADETTFTSPFRRIQPP
jgi:hypothetical protein